MSMEFFCLLMLNMTIPLFFNFPSYSDLHILLVTLFRYTELGISVNVFLCD